jgi:hypothetical protein
MLDGNWDFEGWIVGGLVAIAAAYVLVFAAFNPTAKRVLALARQPGASSPEYERKLRRLEAIGWTELAVLVGALFLMTTKPF